MQRKTPLVEGEFFHIYNRGVEKRILFLDVHDYHRFMMLLYLCNSNQPVNIENHFRKGRTFTDIFSVDRDTLLVDISAWCLMPNHFHFVLCARQENGITSFLRKLCTGYSTYFNQKYKRSGALFQGKFKSEHLEYDEYLKYLFSYVHLNPVKLIPGEKNWKDIGIQNKGSVKKYIENYEYSSFPDYNGIHRIYNSIITKNTVLDIHTDFNEMIQNMFVWLDREKE